MNDETNTDNNTLTTRRTVEGRRGGTLTPFDSVRAAAAAKARHAKYKKAAEQGVIEAAAAVDARAISKYDAWLMMIRAQAVKALEGDTRAVALVGKYLQVVPEGLQAQVNVHGGVSASGLEVTPELRVLVDMVRERAANDPAFSARLERAREEVSSRG